MLSNIHKFAYLRNKRAQLERLGYKACTQAYLYGRSSKRADVVTISFEKVPNYSNGSNDTESGHLWDDTIGLEFTSLAIARYGLFLN